MKCSECIWNSIKRAMKGRPSPCTVQSSWTCSCNVQVSHLTCPILIWYSVLKPLPGPSAHPFFLLPLGKVPHTMHCLSNKATCTTRLLFSFSSLSSPSSTDIVVNNCSFCFLQKNSKCFLGELDLNLTAAKASQPKFLPALPLFTFCLVAARSNSRQHEAEEIMWIMLQVIFCQHYEKLASDQMLQTKNIWGHFI